MSEQNNNPLQNKNRPLGSPKRKFNFYWIYGILAVVFIALNFYDWNGSSKETTWGQFEKMLRKKDVEKIVVRNREVAQIYIKKDRIESDTTYKDFRKQGFGGSINEGPHYTFEILSIDSFEEKVRAAEKNILTQDTANAKTAVEKARILKNFEPIDISNETHHNWGGEILSWVVPIVLLIVLWFVLMRFMGRGSGGGQIFNVGKSKAQLFDKNTSVSINFNDVAGLDEAKVEVMEIVEFLKDPKKYTQLGGKIPKGALLVGPPGTGKTLLAKAVAGEAKVPFFSLSGSDFVEMFVGVGASRVRDLFKQAKEKAPCIIFIDEIDAIGRARGRNAITGANDERENTLNQLLTEMDGFSSNQGVIILAATNRADILDRALLRAGRFDRQIHVELPDLDERKAIFKVHMRPLKFDENDVDVEFLARQTPGFSGADIANVCNESALIAARKNRPSITKQDFIDAIDRIIGGLEKRNKLISQDEKKVIAFHEAGHASVSWLVRYASPLVKVTIVPRGKSLGAAWYLPEERQITTTEQMFDEITATLAGRASEEVNFGKISTGALNDLERVTKAAFAMTVYYGLNKKIGNISYYDSTGQQEYSFQKPYSEKTAEVIDKEISHLIETAYERAKKIITDNIEKVKQLADILLEKEVIFREDVEAIFGKREWEDYHAEQISLEVGKHSSASHIRKEKEKQKKEKIDAEKAVDEGTIEFTEEPPEDITVTKDTPPEKES
jgi:cell division protease FtsH